MGDKHASRERVKDLRYWQERGGQIEWRLAEAEAVVVRMKKDLQECDDMIAKLKSETTEKKSAKGPSK